MKKPLSLGEKIKRIRILEDKTQEEMSDLLGVCQSSYSTWEKFNRIPPAEKMLKIIELGKKYSVTFVVEDLLRPEISRVRVYKRGPKK